jgi:predicted PurR-regulated permease PerM
LRNLRRSWHETEGNTTKRSLGELARIAAMVVIICATLALSIVCLWEAADAVFALGFGILSAVIFDAAARVLGYLVSWNRRLRLLIVIILAAAAVLGVIWWGGTLVVSEARSLAREMHGLFRHAEEVLRTESNAGFPPGANPMKPSPDVGVVVGGAATVVRKLFEVVIFFGIAMFVGGLLRLGGAGLQAGNPQSSSATAAGASE